MRFIVALFMVLLMFIALNTDAYARAQNLDSILLEISKNYLQPNNMTLYSMEKNRPVDLSLLLGGYLNSARRSSNGGARLEQECTRYLGEVAQRANPVDRQSGKRVSRDLLVNYFKQSSLNARIARSIQNKYAPGASSSSSSGSGLTYAPPSNSLFSDGYNPGSGSGMTQTPPTTGLFTDGYNPGAAPARKAPRRIAPRTKAKLIQKHDAISLLGERADGINRTPRQQPTTPTGSGSGKLLQRHDTITALGERADRPGAQRRTGGKSGVVIKYVAPPPYLSRDLIVGTWTRYKCPYRWVVQKRGDSYFGYTVGAGPRKTFLAKEIRHSTHMYQPDVSYDCEFSAGQGKSYIHTVSLWENDREPGKYYLNVESLNFKR